MSDSDNVRNLGWLTCFGRRCHQITDSVMIFPLFHLVVPNKLWSQWLFHSNLSRRLSKPPGKYLRFWICRHLACLNKTNIRNTSHTCNCGTYRKCESQEKLGRVRMETRRLDFVQDDRKESPYLYPTCMMLPGRYFKSTNIIWYLHLV